MPLFFSNSSWRLREDNAEEAQQAAEDDTTFLNLVIAGDLKAAERMILSGTSASCVDDQLRTPLHYAAYNGDRDMAALLCDYDADIEAFDASVSFPAMPFSSQKVILYSAACSSFLLPIRQGNTALHVSAARGTTRTLLFLLEYAAIVDVQNDVGDTPLHLATWFGNRECVRHLLNYSASLDILNSYGLDPYNNVFSRYVHVFVAKRGICPGNEVSADCHYAEFLFCRTLGHLLRGRKSCLLICANPFSYW